MADARGDVSADVSPDVSPDVAPDVAPDGSADATCDVPPTACCCSGDVLDTVTCGASGPTCRPGYGLYFGDDCQCLPGRDTPCCLPHVWDAGH